MRITATPAHIQSGISWTRPSGPRCGGKCRGHPKRRSWVRSAATAGNAQPRANRGRRVRPTVTSLSQTDG